MNFSEMNPAKLDHLCENQTSSKFVSVGFEPLIFLTPAVHPCPLACVWTAGLVIFVSPSQVLCL